MKRLFFILLILSSASAAVRGQLSSTGSSHFSNQQPVALDSYLRASLFGDCI